MHTTSAFLTGYGGIAITIISALACALSGSLLSKCWMTIKERHPDDFSAEEIKSAYPHIAEYAGGKIARYAQVML
jgi:hypothetical protein